MLKTVATAICAGALACGCTALRVGEPPAPRPVKADKPVEQAQAAVPVAPPGPTAPPRTAPSQTPPISPQTPPIPPEPAATPAPPASAPPAAVADDEVIIDDNAPRFPLTGGYAPADPADVGASAAQKIAIDEIYRRDPTRALVENVTRELQVVAGLNYRFVVTMSGGVKYRVVVYRPLQGDMRVTEYEKLQ